jgi:predicted ABC-type transport system involved in lysophospholipase L1 biosynthesis ATPase subunit
VLKESPLRRSGKFLSGGKSGCSRPPFSLLSGLEKPTQGKVNLGGKKSHASEDSCPFSARKCRVRTVLQPDSDPFGLGKRGPASFPTKIPQSSNANAMEMLEKMSWTRTEHLPSALSVEKTACRHRQRFVVNRPKIILPTTNRTSIQPGEAVSILQR